LRFSPALANKPKVQKDPNAKAVDVFEDPKKLLVTSWPPAHNLVLNKFAINAFHFILATEKFEEQTYLLEEQDIGAAYECIKAYKDQREELFAFFNSGEHSGASQRRRHIQFLPVNSMRNGISDENSWHVLADQLVAEDKPSLFPRLVCATL
jgi:ATP adenylyltransferase